MAQSFHSTNLFCNFEEDTQEIKNLLLFIDQILFDLEGFTKENTILIKRNFESFFGISDEEDNP